MKFFNHISTFAEGGNLEQTVKPITEKFYEIAGVVFPIVLSVVAILIIIKLILLGMKLAQSGDDPEERSRIIKGMIWWGIGLLITIAAATVSGVVFNVIVNTSKN